MTITTVLPSSYDDMAKPPPLGDIMWFSLDSGPKTRKIVTETHIIALDDRSKGKPPRGARMPLAAP